MNLTHNYSTHIFITLIITGLAGAVQIASASVVVPTGCAVMVEKVNNTLLVAGYLESTSGEASSYGDTSTYTAVDTDRCVQIGASSQFAVGEVVTQTNIEQHFVNENGPTAFMLEEAAGAMSPDGPMPSYFSLNSSIPFTPQGELTYPENVSVHQTPPADDEEETQTIQEEDVPNTTQENTEAETVRSLQMRIIELLQTLLSLLSR